MARTLRYALPLALLLSFLASPAQAVVGQIFRGQIAFSTWFQSYDTSGCIMTGARTVALNGTMQNLPGPPTPSGNAFIEVIQYDVCQSTYLFLADGFPNLGASDLRFSPNLGGAVFDATVQLCDEFNPSSCFPFTIDLTWTPTGPITRQSSHMVLHTGTSVLILHDHITTRAAQVAGVITDGATNFTQNATDGALTSQGSWFIQAG